VDDLFIECLKKGGDYALIHPRTGAEVVRISAEKIFETIAECAWRSGDPGILFVDRINRANPIPGLGKLEATNPCGEQPLLPYESCTLGSINLTRIVSRQDLDFHRLEELVRLSVHFLDNVVEINRYPLRQVEELSRTNRKIGLGVMGFADMLILLDTPYQSEKAIALADKIMSRIQRYAEDASAELADKRGNFPSFDHSIFPSKGIKKRRNATLTTIAPTGTISLIAGVSSGIEPVFAFEVKRQIVDTVYDEVHPILDRYRRQNKAISGNIFQTAWDIDPEWHLKVQASFQQYTDNAVSKTINLPDSASVEDIKRLFFNAVDSNIKGVTVYRDQSHEDQILKACSLKRAECS
jgi:ribonucleoside-diphosphate reductase alpha chain